MNNWLLLLALLLGFGRPVQAFDALNIIKLLTSAEPENTPPAQAEACGRSSMMTVKTCDIGAGFLCVNTPSLGVVEDYVMIKGTSDLKNNSLTSITISIQNEYTNEYQQIKFDKPNETKDCWDKISDYCLDENGFFSIKAPLGQKYGPYSIAVTATRSNGAPMAEKVRVSHVTAPTLSQEDVKVEQNGGNANITIDMLHSCQFCDFIGTSTGGLEVTVTNIITDMDGSQKQVTEKTNGASAGIFSVCLPLSQGTNNINVSVCNAATGFDTTKCPNVSLNPISGDAGNSGIQWITPIKQVYSADIDPDIELVFKLTGADKKSCDENNVTMTFNRNDALKICAEGDGAYHLRLMPEPGVNVGAVNFGDVSYPFTFGWGEIVSPFKKDGKTKSIDELTIKTAGGFSVSQKFLTDTLRDIVNNYFKSDDFKSYIEKIPQMLDKSGDGKTSDDGSGAEIEAIKKDIPHCSEESSASENKYGFKVTRTPVIKSIEIPKMEFKQDMISLTVSAEDVDVRIDAFLDNDQDGKPDLEILPLKIIFKKLLLPIHIKVDRSGSKPKFILTGDANDCDYRPNYACSHKPAILAPKFYTGGATSGGAFIACDTSVDPECNGVNVINSETGLISITMLDTINNMLYCTGSATLTYNIREKMKSVTIPLKLFGDREWKVPVGLDLLGNQFNVNESGIWGNVPAVVGNEDFYSGFDNNLKTTDVGFIRRAILGSSPSIAGPGKLQSKYDFGIAIGEDLINAVLFVLTNQNKGLLDWDLDETFFKKLGFDAVKECDNFKPVSQDDVPSTLCSLRPRVGDLLGSTLTTNGYFQQKHPIMLRLAGNRFLTPRVSFFNKDGKQFLDVQLGDVDIMFYALQVETETDKFGNPIVKLDANGKPLIYSMNLSDPNPDNGPIVKFKLSAIIALEISEVATDPKDPSKLAMTIRPEPKLSHIYFRPVPGGNATIINDASLISALNEKINYGINIYSAPEKAIKIAVPKDVSLDQFSALGMNKISFGKDGLNLKVEDSQEYIDIFAKFIFTQILSLGGVSQTFTVPD